MNAEVRREREQPIDPRIKNLRFCCKLSFDTINAIHVDPLVLQQAGKFVFNI